MGAQTLFPDTRGLNHSPISSAQQDAVGRLFAENKPPTPGKQPWVWLDITVFSHTQGHIPFLTY